MIVVDTNVLVYAVGGRHPLQGPARRLFDLVARGALAATTTAGVIHEFLHVYARRRDRQAAVVQGAHFARLLSPLSRDDATVEAALTLYERHERLEAFDSLLAAVAIAARAEALVSADRAFAEVEGLPFVDLGGPELERLLA